MSKNVHIGFSDPLDPTVTLEDVREMARGSNRFSRNDEKKAESYGDAAYYEGYANAMSDVLLLLIGKDYKTVEAEHKVKYDAIPDGTTYVECQKIIDGKA